MLNRKLGLDLGLKLSGLPRISLTVNGVSQADDSTFTPANPVQGAFVEYAGVISNPGGGLLRLSNLTADGTVITISSGLDATDVPPGGVAHFTVALSTASAGAKSGWFRVDTNISGTLATYTVNASYYVIDVADVVAFISGTIAPKRWYEMRATSGTTEVNAANPGTNNATISNVTLNQAGLLGTGEAFNFASTGSVYVSAPQNTDINGKLPATWIALVYPRTAGEGNLGRIFDKGTDLRMNIALNAQGGSPYNITATVGFSSGALTVMWPSVVYQNRWSLIALRINNDNTLDLFVNGIKQATSSAGSGTKLLNTGAAVIGNNATSGTRAFDGLYDEWMMADTAISDANNLILAQKLGLAA